MKTWSPFATPERNLLFSVSDFDEAHPGPWEDADGWLRLLHWRAL